ncbi:hypothetical protein [Halorubrum sp. CSM-61]|uniref:hypothetical protein n=1 Tax=Halorubrum sp. CSM-61 TaxID=2485838 RepID=UPI0013DE59B1|nr:hypothetical protein [Halorubrum sp. CSM-61]
MARRLTIRRAVICTLVLSLGFFSVFGVGIGVAESDTNHTDTPTITTPGESEDIFLNQNKTTLRNTSITINHTGENNTNISIFIGLEKFEEQNIETNSSKIDSYNISGADVSRISKLDHHDHTIFKIQANPKNETDRVNINEITFADIKMSNINSTVTSRYTLGVSSEKAGKNYSNLKKENQITKSEPFKIVVNSIRVPDQATVSSQALADSTTSAGVTITDFVSDSDSVILITKGYNGTRLAGSQEQPATSVDGRQNISIRSNIVGGKKSIHVIPKSQINITEYEIGDHIPEPILNSAISMDTAHIYSGMINFSNQTYNVSDSSNLTIKEVELRDLNGDNTPYIVSIHPITADGEIVQDTLYGSSDRLTGINEDIKVNLKRSDETNSTIYSSTQLAATLQIYKNSTQQSTSYQNQTYVLPNSDVDYGFVNGGVSETARIKVDREMELGNKKVHISNHDGWSSNRSTIYSGTTIIANKTLFEAENRRLYRVNKNQRVIYAVGNEITNTSSVEFSTRGLQTGKYTFNKSNSTSGNVFRIIGNDDQYTDIYEIGEFSASGGYISFEVHHNSPETSIEFANTDTNTTAATIELATPEEGQTTLDLNTYTAATGPLNESVTVEGPGASIESVTVPGKNGTLSPGTYEIEVRSEQGIAATSDNATVTFTRRSTNELATYTASEADRSELGSAAAVRDAVEDGELSRTDRVTANDTVVYAVNASGLTGLPAARNAPPETGDDLDRLDGLEFGVRSTAETEEVTASDSSDPSGGAPSDSTVHVDETGLYVVADAEDALPTDGEPEPGEEFTAAFRVTDDRLREAASDPPDGHRVTSTVAFVAEQGGSPGGDSERVASGGPVAGGGGGGVGGPGGTGGPAGGAAGGSGAAGSAEGDRQNGPSADGTEGTRGGGDRTAPVRGFGFGSRPTAERRRPLLDGPIAVSTPTATETSGVAEGPQSGASATDVRATDTKESDAGGGGAGASETASGETGDGSERPTPTYENAPIRTTAEDLPGFGPIHSLAALTLAALVAVQRRRGR